MTTELYNIDGMSCAACSSAVERVTRKLPGVQSSDVNLTTAKMTITYDEAQVTPEQIMEKVKKAGFSATLVPKEKDRMEDVYKRQQLGHGKEDYHRQLHHGEQGPGGHGGEMAVRRRPGAGARCV